MKTLSEGEILQRFEKGEVVFPPIHLCLSAREVPLDDVNLMQKRADGILEAHWQGRTVRFVFECKSLSTPKMLDTAIAQARCAARSLNLSPMVIMPYLSEDALRLLEQEGVSGVDLSGNGVILAPEMAVWRSGQPNRFKGSLPLRNVFRGTSSLIVRSFLLRSAFSSLTELQAFAHARLMRQVRGVTGARLTKGTVSKVVQALDESKIILREQRNLRLLNSASLLEHLANNARRPQEKRVKGKTSLSAPEIWTRLSASGLRCVTTGLGSASRYRVLSSSSLLSLYVEDMEETIETLKILPGAAFPNIELIEETDEVVYFDARKEEDILWASPVQAWLELSSAGPREREAAHMLEKVLLRGEGENLL